MKITRLQTLFLALVASATLGSCASKARIEPTRLLLSYDGPTAVAATAEATLVVRSVNVPDYLDRRDIVHRRGFELVNYADVLWAERPAKSITRYLAESLAAQRKDYAVYALTTPSGQPPTVALSVVIDRFDGGEEGTMVLRGNWSLARPGEILSNGRFDATSALGADSGEATARAMQAALASASATLARELPAPPAPLRSARP